MSDETETTDTDTGQAPAQDYDQQSSAWADEDGHQQENGNWCFAAAEQTIQSAFGVQVTQESVAHTVMMSHATGGGASGDALAYATKVATLMSNFELADSDYDTIQPYMDDTMHAILRRNWGDLPLTGRTAQAGGRLQPDAVTRAIDNGGLIAFGNANHWKIIYGYTIKPDTSLYVWVFDPMTGGKTTPKYSAVSSQMQMSYIITG